MEIPSGQNPERKPMKRPWAVTILGALFIVAGSLGLFYHLSRERLSSELVLISLLRLAAVVGGVFLLFGSSWARWLMIGWLAIHVVVSAFHSTEQMVAHCLLLVVVAYFLFKDRAAGYFEPAGPS